MVQYYQNAKTVESDIKYCVPFISQSYYFTTYNFQ